MRRTNSKAAPAPARSTSDCPRSEVARVGGSSSSRPEAVHRDRRTLHGRVTWRSSRRASRPVATRSAVGPAAPFHRPSAPVSSRWSRIARARGSSPSSSPGTVSTCRPARDPEHVAHDDDRTRWRPPDEAQRAEPLQRSAHGGVGGRDLERVGLLDQCLQHRELEGVEAVERPEHRRLDHDPGGQLGGVVRSRGREIGPCLEQRGQLLVRPATELFGEGARCRGGPLDLAQGRHPAILRPGLGSSPRSLRRGSWPGGLARPRTGRTLTPTRSRSSSPVTRLGPDWRDRVRCSTCSGPAEARLRPDV